jgi:single stranded DNA-binding protein (ssb)
MILTGLARLGRDAEVRYTPDGTPVANLSLAFNYGRKGDDGHRPTQWLDAQLWGQRAESLSEYLTKGTAVSVVLEDPHVETYDKRDGGQGYALRARVVSLEFAGGGESRQQQSQPQRQARNEYAEMKGRPQQAQHRPAPTMDDLDTDQDCPF